MLLQLGLRIHNRCLSLNLFTEPEYQTFPPDSGAKQNELVLHNQHSSAVYQFLVGQVCRHRAYVYATFPSISPLYGIFLLVLSPEVTNRECITRLSFAMLPTVPTIFGEQWNSKHSRCQNERFVWCGWQEEGTRETKRKKKKASR